MTVLNSIIILGVVLIVFGAVVFVFSQLLLRGWIKKYNREWYEGVDKK